MRRIPRYGLAMSVNFLVIEGPYLLTHFAMPKPKRGLRHGLQVGLSAHVP